MGYPFFLLWGFLGGSPFLGFLAVVVVGQVDAEPRVVIVAGIRSLPSSVSTLSSSALASLVADAIVSRCNAELKIPLVRPYLLSTEHQLSHTR